MPWKNNSGEISELRPIRVRLPNSETRTSEEITNEILEESGWVWEEPIQIDKNINFKENTTFGPDAYFSIT